MLWVGVSCLVLFCLWFCWLVVLMFLFFSGVYGGGAEDHMLPVLERLSGRYGFCLSA